MSAPAKKRGRPVKPKTTTIKKRSGKLASIEEVNTKLTPEVHAKIIEVVREGSFMETAAAVAGISPWTFKNWLTKGRQQLKDGRNNVFTRFVRDLDQARAEAEEMRIGRIAQAGANGVWQADAWWLERSFPDRFGRRMRVDGKVQVQAVPLIDVSRGTAEELEQLRGLLAKFAPAADDPALSEQARPALELLPGETIEGELVDEQDG